MIKSFSSNKSIKELVYTSSLKATDKGNPDIRGNSYKAFECVAGLVFRVQFTLLLQVLWCLTFYLCAVYYAPYIFKFTLENFRQILLVLWRAIWASPPTLNTGNQPMYLIIISDTTCSEILNLKARSRSNRPSLKRVKNSQSSSIGYNFLRHPTLLPGNSC